jgi:hypothetical protein
MRMRVVRNEDEGGAGMRMSVAWYKDGVVVRMRTLGFEG